MNYVIINKLTDYVVKNYIEDARFSLNMWNDFYNIGERACTNNHLEGHHRQLNATVRTNPDLWTWINEAKSSEESVMSKNKHRNEQQDQKKEEMYKMITRLC